MEATATKLHVLAAPGCDCPECTFIRQAYECHCACCGCRWQAAFATSELATQAMGVHLQDCQRQRQARTIAMVRKRTPTRPQWFPCRCGWCGQEWAERFQSYQASQRFLRRHVRGCYLQHQQKVSA